MACLSQGAVDPLFINRLGRSQSQTLSPQIKR